MGKNFSIEYLPVAEEDLTNIIDYIMLDNPNAAMTMANKLDQSILTLELFPNSGKIPDDIRLQSLGYRILVVESYLIFYIIYNETVEIRRILHGKRKYNFLL